MPNTPTNRVMRKVYSGEHTCTNATSESASLCAPLVKRFAFFLILSLLWCVPSWAQSESDDVGKTMKIGYTDGSMELNLGLYIDLYIRGAMQLPESYTKRLAGNKITSIRVAMGDELTMQDCNYVFITDKLEGEPLYKQAVDHFTAGWNEVKLNTPFEITANELYIGFAYHSGGDVLSMDGRADNHLANWVLISQRENDEEAVWQHQGGGCLNLQAIVEGETLPQNDASIYQFLQKNYACTGGDTPVKLIVRNEGAKPIRSLDVACRINDEEAKNFKVEGLFIAGGDYALVNVGDVVFTQSGLSDIKVGITRVNDVADEDAQNNEAEAFNIICKKDYTPRQVLLEHFSTAKCPNCPTAHKTIERALKYHSDDVIHVVHHAGFFSDFLTFPAAESYLYFFGMELGGSAYAPAMMLDRTNMSPYGADDGLGHNSLGPAFFPKRESIDGLLGQALSVPAYIDLKLTPEYDKASRTLTVDVIGKLPSGKVEKLSATDSRLTIFLTEDSIAGFQEGTNESPYYHNSALRAVLTDVWGDKVDFVDAAFQSHYAFVLPDAWRENQIRVIAFLSNLDGNDSNHCQVFNATSRLLLPSTAQSLTDLQVDNRVRISITNGYLRLLGTYQNATLYSASGEVVATVSPACGAYSLSALPVGVYLIRIRTAAGVQTVKFVR